MRSDPDAGQIALDLALERVDSAADPTWRQACKQQLDALIARGLPFTTDDLWLRLDGIDTPERRAIGAVIRSAALDGRITPTGRFIKSDRPECHRRPVAVWTPTNPRATQAR